MILSDKNKTILVIVLLLLAFLAISYYVEFKRIVREVDYGSTVDAFNRYTY